MKEMVYTDEATISRISDTAPRALSTYFVCLHALDTRGAASFKRDDIIHNKVRSWTKFKNDIRALSRMFLMSFLDEGDQISIEIIPQEHPLCLQ